MKQTLLLVLCLLFTGCNKTAVPTHPGAISNVDSYAYDVLLVEQDVINTARADYMAGKLPPAAKDLLNAAIAQYNVAQSAWQSYHASGGDATALQTAINALIGAVGGLQQALGKTPTTVPVPISALQPCLTVVPCIVKVRFEPVTVGVRNTALVLQEVN